MALPSSGSGSGDKQFVANVEVRADEQSVRDTSRKIQESLRKALEGIDLAALSKITENLKQQGVSAQQTAVQAERLKREIEKTAQAQEKTAQAQEKTAQAQEKTAQSQQKSALAAAQAKDKAVLAEQKLATEAARSALQQEKLAQATERTSRASSDWLAKADSGFSKYKVQIEAIVSKQESLIAQNRALLSSIPTDRQPFTVGNLLGAAGDNFLKNILSGQGIGAGVKSTLSELKGPLSQIALGGNQAASAFNALGVSGAGATTGLTAGVAGLAAGLLVIGPLVLDIGGKLVGAFGAAYESQKEFIFQSGLIQKQLGLTAAEGAKARALLTLVGQENNVFATITLSQIQASIAALDRVDKGLEKPTAQVANFGKALKELGVDYKTQEGQLKNFVSIVAELSGALEKLPDAQRSLAIQNLAGLFGSDVAKVFGFGEAGITEVTNNAVAISQQLQAENDALQIQLTNTASAYTRLEIAATSFLTPLQKEVELLKERAFLVAANFLEGPSPEERLLQLFKDRANLLAGTGALEVSESNPVIVEIDRQIVEIQKQLAVATTEAGKAAQDAAPSVDALKGHYGDMDDALQGAIAAEKEYADIQKQIEKQNLDITRSFDSQINALQSVGNGYDDYFTKVGDIKAKIDEIQAKAGKPVTIIGTGTVKDIEKALLDIRYTEARISELTPTADKESERVSIEKMQKKVRELRAALGLQEGEQAIIANVDIRVATSKLSKDDAKKVKEYFEEYNKIREDFLAGGFDVAQESLREFLEGVTGNQALYDSLLTGGASSLQEYAESLGLFTSPGFSQALGESALKARFLAGAFGDINNAATIDDAFKNYTDAVKNFRRDIFDLGDFISGAQELTIPLAIKFGLITSAEVKVADTKINVGSIDDAVEEQAAQAAAQAKKDAITSGKGIVDLLLEKYGITPGEPIKAIAEFELGANVDHTLADKQTDAAARALEKREDAREINAKWNLNVTFNDTDLEGARRQIEALAAALGGAATPPPPGGINPTTAPPRDDTYIPPGRAYGGNVNAGQPYSFLEQGKPELYQPYGSGKQFLFIPPAAGNVQGGDAAVAMLSHLAGRERLPAQPSITYAPQIRQEVNIDARGQNEQAVTQAIKRANVADQFRSALPSVRQRDLQRSLGVY